MKPVRTAPALHSRSLAALVVLALSPLLPAQDAPPVTPPPSAVTPVAPGAQATPAPKTPPTGGGDTPTPAAGDTPPSGSGDAAARIVKAVPGRFSVQLPAGMFQFVPDSADKNKLTGAHLKAAVNGVVISIIASKAAATDLDAAVDKAVAQAIERSKLPAPSHTEFTYAGHKAYKYEYTTTIKDKPAVYFSYILRDDERVYIFTASVYASHRAEFEPVFDAIAKSIAKDSFNPDAKPAGTQP